MSGLQRMRETENPEYIFQMINTTLLTKAVKGEIDLEYYARLELANRGLDSNGVWVGFDKAKIIHRI